MSDIQRLFDEDPLKLTKPDYVEIVRYYQSARHQFALGDKKAGKSPAKKAADGPKLTNLDDILSDL